MENTNNTNTKILDFIKESQKKFNFNRIEDYINFDLFKQLDKSKIRNYLEDLDNDWNITNCDITYHYNAIEFLKNKDQSLANSIELAKDYWYGIDDINSELLASLLASNINKDNYKLFLDWVSEFIETL